MGMVHRTVVRQPHGYDVNIICHSMDYKHILIQMTENVFYYISRFPKSTGMKGELKWTTI